MAYICQSCGVEAEDEYSFCNPIDGELEGKSCYIVAGQVCCDKYEAMKFACESCGRISTDDQYLCHPSEIK